VVRSIGGTAYRIRWESQLIARSDPSEDLVGGFVICTVLGAEILDGNFQRINPEIVITEPTPIYVRYLMGSAMGGAPTMTVKVDTRWPAPDGTVYSPAQDLTLTQLASSGVYLGAGDADGIRWGASVGSGFCSKRRVDHRCLSPVVLAR